jgi:hypothetical protein
MMMFMKSPSFWLTVALVSVVYLGFYNALIINIHTIATGEPSSLKAAFVSGIRRALPMLGVSIVFMVLIAIGFVLLVIPGIYLWGIFQLVFVVVLVENAGVFESFSISRRLIKGHWWRSATIMTVAFIIMLVFSLVAGLVAGVMAGIMRTDVITSTIVQLGVSTLLRALFLTLFPSFLLAMYYDLKLRYEGDDLAERVAALQT